MMWSVRWHKALAHTFDERKRHGKPPIPQTAVMSTNVSDRRKGMQHLLQYFYGRHSQSLGNFLFCSGIRGVFKPSGKCAERHGFDNHPNRRQKWFIVLFPVMHHGRFAAAFKFCGNFPQIAGMLPWVLEQLRLHMGMAAMAHRQRACPAGA